MPLATHLATLLLAVCTLLAGPAASQPPPPVTKEDLLVVFGTHEHHASLIQASRAWRKNVRAHIVLDPAAGMHTYRSQGQKFGETFSVTPDFPGQRVVLRHVLAPLMAHHTYKTHASPGYKWMLLGDDDTIWGIEGVLAMLNELQLSHTEPVALSDYLVRCEAHPLGFAAPVPLDHRCEQCAGGMPACPCRLRPEFTGPGDPGRTMCPAPSGAQFYGGSGLILSHGMLEALTADPRHYYRVAFGQFSPYSDMLITEAMRLVGFGHTAPFPRPSPDAPAPEFRRFGTFDDFNEERNLEQLVVKFREAAGRHPDALRRMVTAHVRNRGGTLPDYLIALHTISAIVVAGQEPGAAAGTAV